MSPSSSSAIAVSDLTVVRGGHEVRSALSLEVASGTVTGLLGPSGCGKSTLMRAIVGVQVVASGSVSVLGEAAGSASLRCQVGYVTRAPSVYADLSDEENLRFFASVVGAEHSRIPEVVEIVVSAATRTGSLARCREVSGRVVMFLITSIAMLRERTSGTLWALPLTYSYDALARATGPARSAAGSHSTFSSPSPAQSPPSPSAQPRSSAGRHSAVRTRPFTKSSRLWRTVREITQTRKANAGLDGRGRATCAG